MSYYDVFKREKADYLVPRSTKPVYKCENVLTTELLPLPQFSQFCSMMDDVPKEFPDSWFLHATMTGNPADVVHYVPTIINSFNRSRPLRRMRISGLRMCNYVLHTRRPYYVTDMVVTSAYGAMLFMSSMLKYYTDFPNVAYVEMRAGIERKVKCNNRLIHERVTQKYWKRSKLPRHYMQIVPDFDDPMRFGSLTWSVKSPDLISSVWSMIETIPDEISYVKIGNITMSHSSDYEAADYCVRQFDQAVTPLRFRRFSAFGCFHNNAKYLLY